MNSDLFAARFFFFGIPRRESDAAHEVLEARVWAQLVEDGVNVDEGQYEVVFFVSAIKPVNRLLAVPQVRVMHRHVHRRWMRVCGVQV